MSPEKERYRENYDTVRSRYGGFLGGKALFRGVTAGTDLAGVRTQTEAMLLGFLGRLPEPAETRLFDALICLNIYPDPRIWCMRAGAYAAAAGSPFSSAYGAAITVFNSRIYGVQPVIKCGEFLIRALAAREGGVGLRFFLDAEIEREGIVPGFGRPVAPGPDERYLRCRELLAECGFSKGPAFSLIEEASLLLSEDKGIWPNYAGAFAALMLDPPFSLGTGQLEAAVQCIAHMPLLFAIQDVAENYGERLPFLPLKVDDVFYSGPGPRALNAKEPS